MWTRLLGWLTLDSICLTGIYCLLGDKGYYTWVFGIIMVPMTIAGWQLVEANMAKKGE